MNIEGQNIIPSKEPERTFDSKKIVVGVISVVFVLGLFFLLSQLGIFKPNGGSGDKISGDGEVDVQKIPEFPQYPDAKQISSPSGTYEWEVVGAVPQVTSWYFDKLIETGWVVETPPLEALSQEEQELIVRKDGSRYKLVVKRRESITLVTLTSQ